MQELDNTPIPGGIDAIVDADHVSAPTILPAPAKSPKPKRKRAKKAAPRTKKPDPILEASKADAPTSPSHVATGAQPVEGGSAASPEAAEPVPFDREARFVASVFQADPRPRPDLALPTPSRWWQRFVAPFQGLFVERGVAREGSDGALVIDHVRVVADMGRKEVRAWVAILAASAVIGGALGWWTW